jgi:pimeloyl-ACP methyl ester carboxylesterase
LIEGKENLYFGWFLKSFAINQVAVEAEIPRVVTEFTGVGAIRGGLQLFRARNGDAALNVEWAKTNRLKMPVLAMGGEGGTGSTLFDQMSTIADVVEGGVIQGCGHWIVIECPGAFLSRIGPFLEGNKAK